MRPPASAATSSSAVGAGLTGEMVAGVGALDREAWTDLFGGEVEGWDYYRACEAAAPKGFAFRAAAVRQRGRLVAAAPTFAVGYRLDTPVQGRLRRLTDRLHARAPGLVELKVLSFGSPLADRCHVGFAPDLSPAERETAARALVGVLVAEAARENAAILAVKDLADRDVPLLAAALADAGFARIASLPVAVLDLPFRSEDEYLASLSAATRKDVRRKVRASSAAVWIEERMSIAGLEAEIRELYEETRRNSGVDYGDFEELPPDYFRDVSRALGERAVFMLYRIDGRLAAFNLLLVEPGTGRVIDKFLGMRYPQGREHNLYVLSWLANVRFCLARGIARLQTGQTAYAMKLRMGSRLEKSWVYFRHRNAAMNRLFRTFAPLFAFDRMDPDLKKLAEEERKAAKQ